MKRAFLALALAVTPVCIAQERPAPSKADPSASAAAVNTSPLTHEIDLDAPVAKVWEAFSTEEGYKRWGVARVKIDCRVGGKIQSHYNPKGEIGDEGTIENTILAFEPHRMMAFQISKPPKGFPFMNAYKSMWTVATMTDLGEGRTRLRLTQVGYTADEESQKMRAFFDQGNLYALKMLKANLTGDAPGAATAAAAAADDPLAAFTVEAVVKAMPGEVWSSWTTSAGFKAFMGAENNIDLRLGGPFEIYFSMTPPEGQRGSEGCTILSYDPGRMLSFTWNAPPKFAHARAHHTWVIVTIEPFGAHSSRVILKHQGFAELARANPDHAEEWKQVRAYFKNAWPNVLDALRDHYGKK